MQFASEYGIMYLAALFVLLVPVTGRCPGVCRCPSSDEVNCSSLSLTNVPADWFGRYVKDLDISENLLQSLDSTSLKHVEVRFLQHLIASKNHIFKIHEEAFVRLDKLQSVDLSSNDLTFIHRKTFARNPSLKRLSLASNKHLKLPAEGFFLHSFYLRVLNLSDCNLTHIPPKIFQGLLNLQELYISHNAIEVLHSVETAGRLTVLDVGHNNLTDLKPDIFTAFPKLSRLNLSYNNLGALDMTVTAQLANVSSHMDLTGNPWVCAIVLCTKQFTPGVVTTAWTWGWCVQVPRNVMACFGQFVTKQATMAIILTLHTKWKKRQR